MKAHVVSTLAEYLGAWPYQVEAWDRRVIISFLDDMILFDAFRQGTDHAKWHIYNTARHA